MNDETQTPDPKARVSDLLAQKKQATADLKEAKAGVREAKANVKAAENYRKALSDEDENVPAADEALNGWTEAVNDREANATELENSLEQIKADLEQARADAKAAKAKPKPKSERVEKNGIKQPVGDGPSAIIWAEADKVSAEKGSPAAVADIMEACIAAGVKEGTVKAGYSHWRKFHGIQGRVKSIAEIEKEKAKAAEDEAAVAE